MLNFRRNKINPEDISNLEVVDRLTAENDKLKETVLHKQEMIMKKLEEINRKFDLNQGRKNVQVSKG